MNYNNESKYLQPSKACLEKRAVSATKEDDLGRRGSESSPLGTNAKSLHTKTGVFVESKGLELKSTGTLSGRVNDTTKKHTLEFICKETGEITNFTKDSYDDLKEELNSDKLVAERYMLLSSVRHLMPLSRTAKCNRLSRGGVDITALKNIEFNSVNFSGLQTCGSVWVCPWCGSKISERRKNEVVQALQLHSEKGGSLYFLTFTFPHSKEQDLRTLRKKQAEALRRFRNSRTYKKYLSHIGYVGLIRALEVTWGKTNGWHPHTHEIFFGDNKVSFQSIKRILFPAWVHACEKSGLGAPSFRRGLDVRGGEKAGDYVNKYGSELTKSHFKKATGDRFSPFDLLRSYFYDDVKLHGAKFVEFAEGISGASQLYWSDGLKDIFYINDKSDEELAEEFQEKSIILGQIKLSHWRAIVKYKAMATIRIMFSSQDPLLVFNYIEDLYVRYECSGDKEEDDKRIKANREKYKKDESVTQKALHDKKDVFERINEKINKEEYFSRNPMNSDLSDYLANFSYTLNLKDDDRNNFCTPLPERSVKAPEKKTALEKLEDEYRIRMTLMKMRLTEYEMMNEKKA